MKKTKLNIILVLTVILIAANMRACYTGVGTIVSFIQADLGINSATAGMLSTIPLMIFAVVCPLSAPLSARIGIGKMLLVGAILNTLGCVLRAFAGALGLFAGTAILAVGVGIMNALMVGLIKLRFADRVGLVTSIYTTTMAVTSAVGLAINVPITTAIGWRGNLAVYGAACLLAVLVWLPQCGKSENRGRSASGGGELMRRLFKSRRAWLLTGFMGTQSLMFYCITAWMPSMLQWRGLTPAEASTVATTLQLVSLPTTLLTPILADKINMRIPILGFGVCYAIGMGSFYFVGAGTFAMWVSIVILAIGMGSGFSACIFLFSKKTSSAGETAAISGFAQCGGYVFSSIGPVFMGWTYDVSGSWNTAIIFGFLVSVAMMIFAALSSNSSNVFEK